MKCAALGCGVQVGRMFMCKPHWHLVPPEVKRVFKLSLEDYTQTLAKYERKRHSSVEEGDEARAAITAFRENRVEVVRIVRAIEEGRPA